MDNEQLVIAIQDIKGRSLRNEGRIKKLEDQYETLHQLATSVAVMAEQLRSMNDSLDELTGKVTALEGKPAKRWESLVDKAIWAVAAAVIGFLLARIGLG